MQDNKFLSAPIVREHFRDYKHIGTDTVELAVIRGAAKSGFVTICVFLQGWGI